jgi:hypothetical protein
VEFNFTLGAIISVIVAIIIFIISSIIPNDTVAHENH